jgi:glucose-1-phosphate adenylyltransferase
MLFFNAHVDERSEIFRTVLLPHVRVGRRCRIRRAIIDEGCVIPDDTVIGENQEADARRFHVTENGVVLVTGEMLAELSRQENRPHEAAAARSGTTA